MCQPKDILNVENGEKNPDSMSKEKDSVILRSRPIRIEDALEKTKFGKFNYFLILISGIILYAALVETCGISFALPVSQCDMNYTQQQMGIITAVGFMGIIFSSHLWGFLADTIGRKRVMKPTLLISITCTIFSTLTSNFWLFATFRFLTGFFISGSSATIYAYIGEFHGVQQRSRAIIGSAFVFGVCCVLLPLSAYTVINQKFLEFYVPFFDITYKPWRLFMFVCAIPSIISFLALIILPESPKFELSQGRQAETIQILEKINRWNNGGKAAVPLGITEIYEEREEIENRLRQQEQKKERFSWLKTMWTQTALLFKPPHLRTTLLACIIQFGLFATGNGFYMWFAEILNRLGNNLEDFTSVRIPICDVISKTRNFNMTETTGQMCIEKLELSTLEHGLTLEILYPIGYALMGAMINYVGKLALLVSVMIGCGIAGIAVVLVNIPLIATYMFIILLCGGLATTVVNATTVELYPTNLRAMAMCISLMMGRVGSVFGTNIVAYMLDDHCEGVFILSGSSLIVCAFLCFFIPNIRQASNPPKEADLGPRLSISSRIG